MAICIGGFAAAPHIGQVDSRLLEAESTQHAKVGGISQQLGSQYS